jgi:hypothetical protein
MLMTGAASPLRSEKAAFQLGRACLQKRQRLSCKEVEKEVVKETRQAEPVTGDDSDHAQLGNGAWQMHCKWLAGEVAQP